MMDSSNQLRLRILTGAHAGAEISFSQGEYVIGSDVGCDVIISDWTYKRTSFSIAYLGAGEYAIAFDAAALTEPFGINQPRCIGDVVVVVSEAGNGSVRPSDLELLTKMLVVPPPAIEKRTLARKIVIAVLVVAGTAGTALTLHGTDSVAVAKVVPASEVPLVKVRAVVRKIGNPGIKATAEGNTIVVSGMVKDRQERQVLAAQLNAIKNAEIQHRYAVESEIASAVTDAIAHPGVIVRHVGNGNFQIEGEITPTSRQRINLEKVKADLGPLVKSLSFPETVQQSQQEVEFDEKQMKKGYQFRVAADGAKYFVPQ